MSTLLRMAGIDVKAKAGRSLAEALHGETLPPELWTLMLEVATRFSVAGGRWSPTDWCRLTRPEQAACVEAGQRLAAARALQVAHAARGGVDEAEVAAVLDGGAALGRVEALGTEAALRDLRDRTRKALAASGVTP